MKGSDAIGLGKGIALSIFLFIYIDPKHMYAIGLVLEYIYII